MTFDELNEIAKFDKVYEGKNLGMERLQNLDSISTSDFTLHRLYLCTKESSRMYGTMVGIVEYIKGDFYRFHAKDYGYGVFEMNTFDKYVVKERRGVPFVDTTMEDDGLFAEAFWDGTQMEDLRKFDNGSYELRIVMERLAAYSACEPRCKEIIDKNKTEIGEER